MKRCMLSFVPFCLVLSLGLRVQATQMRKSPARPDPGQFVPILIATVKSEPDERKRIVAARELRNVDPRTFPDIIVILSDVAQSDPQWAVRYEAVASLGKLRPISRQAGQSLERAAAEDASQRVRLLARSSLLGYRLAGYSSNKKGTPAGVQSPAIVERSGRPEPSLNSGPMIIAEPPPFPSIPERTKTGLLKNEMTVTHIPRPMPRGFSTAMPSGPVSFSPAGSAGPSAGVVEEGPILSPPH